MKHTTVAGTMPGTIVFIHGNSSSSQIFKKTLTSSKIKNTKIAVDLPGHGNNQNKHECGSDFSGENYQQELVSFIENIEDDILLAGNSMGGHLAIEIAPKITRLKGLAIFGTPPVKKPINFEEAFITVPALQTFLTENPTDQEIVVASKIAVHKEQHSEQIALDFKKANPKVRSAMAFDLMNDRLEDQENIFVNLPVKKFIISGDQDPSVNRTYLEQVIEKCGDKCEFINIEGCGHYPSLEKPKEFNKIISTIATQIF